MKTKNYLLTDFNTVQWNGINIELVKEQLIELNKNIDKIGYLYGELGESTDFCISSINASHAIKNLTFKDNKIYGDIIFLNNENGEKAKSLINEFNDQFNFGIRSVGITKNNEIEINKIFTWDVIKTNK